MGGSDLQDLEYLAAVARHRSFRQAATELGISVSSLSQRIRNLEEGIGVRLLNRTTRSVAPTEAGEQLLSRIGPAMLEVVEALRDVGNLQAAPSGRLRINAPAPAVQLVLKPMVAPFLHRYPQIRLEIISDPSFVDIVEKGFDAGVRYSEHLAQDMIAVPLGPPQKYVVVASPEVAIACGELKEPKDLLNQPCISTRFPSGLVLPWEFEKDGRAIKITPNGRLMATDTSLLLKAAIDGLGFFLTFEDYARAAINAGQLGSVLDDWCPSFPGPFLYYPSRRQPPSALTAFIDFVASWRSNHQPS
jgi:DNA-binding transcriptional LysR family regulator